MFCRLVDGSGDVMCVVSRVDDRQRYSIHPEIGCEPLRVNES